MPPVCYPRSSSRLQYEPMPSPFLIPRATAGGPFSTLPFAQSPCVKPCANGILYFYANEQAMNGLRTGVWADGAVLAEEMLELLVAERGSGEEAAAC